MSSRINRKQEEDDVDILSDKINICMEGIRTSFVSYSEGFNAPVSEGAIVSYSEGFNGPVSEGVSKKRCEVRLSSSSKPHSRTFV